MKEKIIKLIEDEMEENNLWDKEGKFKKEIVYEDFSTFLQYIVLRNIKLKIEKLK